MQVPCTQGFSFSSHSFLFSEQIFPSPFDHPSLQEQSKLKDTIDLLIRASDKDETENKCKASELQAKAEANQTDIVSVIESQPKLLKLVLQ